MGLPPLRQDLGLHAAPPAADGSPCWTLHDPAANRYYRLGWAAFEILSRWHLDDPAAIVNAVNRETALVLDEDHVSAVAAFLTRHHLLDAVGRPALERLKAARNAARQSWWLWLLHHYLFFRIPLFRPARFLDWGAPWANQVFSLPFRWGMGAVLVLSLSLVARQWDSFVHTFSGYRHWSDLLAVGIALSFAKILHEFGHAFAAHRYGCRVPTMGIAFLVMWPVLYTDTNEAWKLVSRRQRMVIGAAGMLAEVGLAIVASLAWALVPDGALRSSLFLLATSTWIVTLGINASPFMRFDGYFLLCDWLDMPNLHGRAFAMGRWWIRERLFGLGEPPPERFAPRRQNFLVAFALATWVYRLVLFFGIALLVYQLFFKLLGLLLMMVELGWFIGLPLWNEMKAWRALRPMLSWNPHTRRTAWIGGALLVVGVLPWRSDITAPAVLGAAESQGLYAVNAALVRKVGAKAGQQVQAGEVLLELDAPDIKRRLQTAIAQEQRLKRQLEQQPFDEALKREGPALRHRWEESVAEVQGIRAQMAQLTLRAPFAGYLADANDGLVEDAWVARQEKLFLVVGTKGIRGEAYLSEQQKLRLEPGGRARFIADMSEAGSISCRIAGVDGLAMPDLAIPYAASIYGGQIPVQKDKRGNLVPLDPVFRVRLDQCESSLPPPMELRGVAVLQGEWRSYAGSAFQWVASVLRRESGF